MAPFTEGPKQKLSKGKLVDKYRNEMRSLMAMAKVSRSRAPRRSEEDFEVSEASIKWDEEALVHADWLKNYSVPWPEVTDRWKKCFCLRRRQIGQNNGSNIEEIMRDWPILMNPLSYLLVS